MDLDHEKPDVYRVSLEFAAWACEICKDLKGANRHAGDRLLRASQSICLNIAERCGKNSSADRGRFLQISCGSARECGAIPDILARCRVIDESRYGCGKTLLVRIVAMLTRMIQGGNKIREKEIVYGYVNENVHGTAEDQINGRWGFRGRKLHGMMTHGRYGWTKDWRADVPSAVR